MQEIAWQTVIEYPNSCLNTSNTNDQQAIDHPIIFPNPGSDKIYIEKMDKLEKLKLYDIHGRKVIELFESNISNNINIDNLQSGVYFLKLHTTKSKKPFTQKLIKN